ncbi:hypothetical protein EVAR_75434_1 [Eumeta japonica]|uniref:Uncharacterized protein n=1 Tax=Eumeta variegata TaxID=151549 RepID=A0A4C1TKW8_EUMVA|nr:hypothetical protein EVAR_75434_1 [Eumeta japonica]
MFVLRPVLIARPLARTTHKHTITTPRKPVQPKRINTLQIRQKSPIDRGRGSRHPPEILKEICMETILEEQMNLRATIRCSSPPMDTGNSTFMNAVPAPLRLGAIPANKENAWAVTESQSGLAYTRATLLSFHGAELITRPAAGGVILAFCRALNFRGGPPGRRCVGRDAPVTAARALIPEGEGE